MMKVDIKGIGNAFVSTGWLLPLVIPLAFMIGRALGNVLLGVYFFWGVLALLSGGIRVPRPLVYLYVGLLAVFLASIPGAVDVARALGVWAKFGAYVATVLFTVAVVTAHREGLERAVRLGAYIAVACILLFAAQLVYYMLGEHFEPRTQLNGLVPAYMFPFVLGFIALNVTSGRMRVVLELGVGAFLLLLLVLAQSRTEVLTLCIGGLAWLWLQSGKHWLSTLVFILLIPAVLFLRGVPSVPGQGFDQSEMVQSLDELSSHRVTLWGQALQDPPDNIWLGVGMGNVRNSPVVEVKRASSAEIAVAEEWKSLAIKTKKKTAGLLRKARKARVAAKQTLVDARQQADPQVIEARQKALSDAVDAERAARRENARAIKKLKAANRGWRKVNKVGRVKHLHNLLLDAWYETGWLGLSALIVFVGYVGQGVRWGLRTAPGRQRNLALPVIVSVFAILASSMTDVSYFSHHFALVGLFCLSLLWAMKPATQPAAE